MRKRTTTPATHIAKAARASMLFSLLILALSAHAQVFSDTPLSVSTTDGSTPLGMAPGAPAGSFALSGFESVNPYNGALNFRLPLLHVGGRGSVQHVITVAVEQHWRVDKDKTGVGLGYVYDPNPDRWSTLDAGYSLGKMVGRRTGLSQAIGALVYCPDGASALTRLTFTTPDGTEFEFRDAPSNGAATANVYVPVGDPPTGCQLAVPQAYSRGRVFVTGDGSAATFISDTNIYEHSDTGDPQSLPADQAFPSGYLFLRDGTCYRIQDAKVAWIRDPNGNRISLDAFTASLAS